MIAVFVFIIFVAIIFSLSVLWYFSFKLKEQQVLNELNIIGLKDKIQQLEIELNNCNVTEIEIKEDFNYYCDDLGIFG